MSSPPNITRPSPSTTLRHETSLSLLYRVLRRVIRPLRPHLVSPGKPQPAGSPRLKNPSAKNGCQIIEHQDPATGLWLYDFVPSSRKTDSQTKKQILYFAGGSFQDPPAREHWSFVSTLAASPALSNHNITIVSYPLAPHSPASDSLPILRRFVADIASQGDLTLTLIGDSAGGNVVLSLGLWLVDQHKTQEKLAFSLSIFVISPAVDLRSLNPDIQVMDAFDPVLSAKSEHQCARAWCANGSKAADPMDPYISPILADESLRRAKELGVKIHGVFGTHDVLAPDTELFRRKCVELDVPGDWLVWEAQMHCFVLAGVYGMKEGKVGIQWIIDTLVKN